MGAKKKRAREGDAPRRLCPADSFLFDRIGVTDNSSLDKLLMEDYNNEKEKKQQQQSPSYDTLLLLLKFRSGQGFNLGKPEFFQAFRFATAQVAYIWTVMTFSAFISA